MSQTLSLYRLQQVDNQIDRIQVRLQNIQNSLGDDTELRLAKERFDTTNLNYQTAEQALNQAERNAQTQRIKIEQTEASLYNGKGHSPKELLDLQNDVEALKRHLARLEDIQLEAMQSVETTLAESNLARSQFLEVDTVVKDQIEELRKEQTGLLKEREKLFSERAAVADPIPPDTLGQYDQLRMQRRGIAVSIIVENSCSACGSSLSAAVMQSSRSSVQIAHCPSCGRILYGN
jgi:predicted  nucleic acid-binding Zn-ribbon protein